MDLFFGIDIFCGFKSSSLYTPFFFFGKNGRLQGNSWLTRCCLSVDAPFMLLLPKVNGPGPDLVLAEGIREKDVRDERV